jgi:PKD repeat protein
MLSSLSVMPAAVWAGTSTQPAPKVTFSTPGDKMVTLDVCNPGGCDTINKVVKVLDPKPVVTSTLVSPLIVQSGQLVNLTGTGTGKPPLTSEWRVLLGTSPLTTISGASGYWNTTGVLPGVYTVALRITNASGFAQSLPALVTVNSAIPLDFYTSPPCRIFDTRLSSPFLAAETRTIQVTGLCGVPAGARAVAANVTVFDPSGSGNVSVYPGNYPQPATSTINFLPDVNRANNGILPLSTDGTGTLKATALVNGGGPYGNTGLVIDVVGYFLPSP